MFIKFKNKQGTIVTLNSANIVEIRETNISIRIYTSENSESYDDLTPETYAAICKALQVVDLTQPAPVVEREWKVGDELEITCNDTPKGCSPHGFPIGREVVIRKIDRLDEDLSKWYHCFDLTGEDWWISRSEARLISNP